MDIFESLGKRFESLAKLQFLWYTRKKLVIYFLKKWRIICLFDTNVLKNRFSNFVIY